MKINYINIILGILLILGICTIIGGTKEMFVAHGKYPKSVDDPMMEDSLYPYKNPRGLSDASYREQWLKYPLWAIGSYEQKQIMSVIGHHRVMEQVLQQICVVDFMRK